MKFQEAETDIQLRVKAEWDLFVKTKGMSAEHFEAEWERFSRELDEAGLPMSTREKYLDFIKKIGPLGTTVRNDLRNRLNGIGGETNRKAKTWEELHAVTAELQTSKETDKAFIAARAAGQTAVSLHQGSVQDGKGSKGKGKDKGNNE